MRTIVKGFRVLLAAGICLGFAAGSVSSFDIRYDNEAEELHICNLTFDRCGEPAGIRIFPTIGLVNVQKPKKNQSADLDLTGVPVTFDECHRHNHSDIGSLIRITDLRTGEVTEEKKANFCMIDTHKVYRWAGEDLHDRCTFQGVSPGWGDFYERYTPGQNPAAPTDGQAVLFEIISVPQLIAGPYRNQVLIDIVGEDPDPSNNTFQEVIANNVPDDELNRLLEDNGLLKRVKKIRVLEFEDRIKDCFSEGSGGPPPGGDPGPPLPPCRPGQICPLPPIPCTGDICIVFLSL